MNKIILSLIFIFIAFICISGACAASDADNYVDMTNQDNIPDCIGDEGIAETVNPANEINIENDQEASSEIIETNSSADNMIIEDMGSNNRVIEYSTADDSAHDVPRIEGNIEKQPLNVYSFVQQPQNKVQEPQNKLEMWMDRGVLFSICGFFIFIFFA